MVAAKKDDSDSSSSSSSSDSDSDSDNEEDAKAEVQAVKATKKATKDDSSDSDSSSSSDSDSDSDGVLDLLDAYPEDPNKSDNEGLYSTLNHFQPITDGPLPKKFCQLLFNIPGEQPKEFSTEWLDANECSVEQPAVAPIPDPSD